MLPPIAILAGGLGTRLGEQGRFTPKALVEVAGQPFLWHQLRLLAASGAFEIVLCVGHLGELIEERIGSQLHGLHIAYSYDQPGLDGTLGAIRRAQPLLGERFLVLYGDTYLRVEYEEFDRKWRASGQPAAMSVLENAGRWGTSNAQYADGLVLKFDKFAPTKEMTFIDYGLGALEARALELISTKEADLARLYSSLAEKKLLFGFEARQRFYEVGSPEALEETARFLTGQAEGASP